MSRRIRRHREVKKDVLEIARYIASDSFDAAMRFFDAVEQEIKALSATPGMGGLMQLRSQKLDGVRSIPIHGFPNHLIIYRPLKRHVEILAIVHGARNLPPIIGERT